MAGQLAVASRGLDRRELLLGGTSIVGAAVATGLSGPASAQEREQIANVFPSRYMNAADTPLVTIARGALVSEETASYWNLPEDSPQRASYDEDIVVKAADGVWTFGSESIVNCHAVEGPEGLVVYDTGDNLADGAHFYDLLRSATDAPIRAIVDSHEHYVAGAKVFIEAEAERGNTDILIIGHPGLNDAYLRTGGVSAVHPEVGSVLLARSIQQFNLYLPEEGPDSRFKNTIIPGAGGFVPVDTPVEDGQELTVAGMKLVFYTEGVGTDTTNQVLVWIPDRKIVMNNVIWGMFPNIYSARGGRYRDPTGWIDSVEIIKQLAPEILLSTHSTTLTGAEAITQRLQDYQDGLAFVRDQTLKGILLGQRPDELSYSVVVPERLKNAPILVQNYGEVSIMPPRIFTAIFGQYDGDAAHLLKLHPQEEAERMVVAMGGPDEVRAKAKQAHEDGDYLWAAQLGDYLVMAQDTPEHRAALAETLRQIGYRTVSTNSRSWLLSRALWLEGKTPILKTAPADPASLVTNLGDYVNYYRVRVSPDRSADTDLLMTLAFEDGRSFGLHVRRSLVDFIEDVQSAPRQPEVAVAMKPETWALVFNNLADPAALIDKGDISITTGGAAQAKAFFALFDPVYDWANDPALQTLAQTIQYGTTAPH
ncbi:alkyl sulfatase dimerization domain-containing protein [Amorphus orientalis]|uniref:Alkyl sulfatase BDS1-like metallo-beta-lactamase superfamily hydrolase n=1 Tax=Amorphus orientalis TaxID=649198 RepID=A0AAE3VN21_9HYPH|nr:alkyl sulfatase dimerization domain-containing protein [Amorphus orientalis]MDQ0314755.1 alkyl sulfatase BDS1-like metallo-beta-lactamase superfamily hydrolase [Amorphus orientalis]